MLSRNNFQIFFLFILLFYHSYSIVFLTVQAFCFRSSFKSAIRHSFLDVDILSCACVLRSRTFHVFLLPGSLPVATTSWFAWLYWWSEKYSTENYNNSQAVQDFVMLLFTKVVVNLKSNFGFAFRQILRYKRGCKPLTPSARITIGEIN